MKHLTDTQKRICNAALHILKMLEDGYVEVNNGSHEVKINGFKQARTLKVGKLHRSADFILLGLEGKRGPDRDKYKGAYQQALYVAAKVSKLNLSQTRKLAKLVMPEQKRRRVTA